MMEDGAAAAGRFATLRSRSADRSKSATLASEVAVTAADVDYYTTDTESDVSDERTPAAKASRPRRVPSLSRGGNGSNSGNGGGGGGSSKATNSDVYVRYHTLLVRPRHHRLLVGVVLAIFAASTLQFLTDLLEPSSLNGYIQPRYDEVTFALLPAKKQAGGSRLGFASTPTLVVTSVTRGSPADDAGMGRFVGRRIFRVNGVPVRSDVEFKRAVVARDLRTSLAEHLTVSFAPTLRPGVAVRVARRLAVGDGVVHQGAIGVALRVPGYTVGSAANVRVRNRRFDVTADKIEPVVAEDVVPRRLVDAPLWIRKGSGLQDVRDIVSTLQFSDTYVDSLAQRGLDRPDHLALARPQEATGLGMKPLHFNAICKLATEVVKERRRKARQQTAEALAIRDVTRLVDAEDELMQLAKLRAATDARPDHNEDTHHGSGDGQSQSLAPTSPAGVASA